MIKSGYKGIIEEIYEIKTKTDYNILKNLREFFLSIDREIRLKLYSIFKTATIL